MRIFLNAGHHLFDPGAWHLSMKESGLNIKLRDMVLPLLQKHAEVISVPDDLNLKESIAWINEYATIDDIAFSIHFNSHSDKSKQGTEVYFHNEREKQIAEIFARTVSSAVGLKNRGAIPDRLTWVGSLGWVRKLICDSVLVEVCYLTNESDMSAYTPEKASQGLENAIMEIIPRKVPEEAEKEGREADLCIKRVSNLMTIINWLVGIINLQIKK